MVGGQWMWSVVKGLNRRERKQGFLRSALKSYQAGWDDDEEWSLGFVLHNTYQKMKVG